MQNTLENSLTNKYLLRIIIPKMRYTFAQFKKDYPDDDACLEAVFQNRFGDVKYCPKCAAETKFYRVKKRQCYACMHCGYQLHPLADTIFRKSSTSLWNWFYAIYLFSVAKNGVSAKELERHLGCTYKTAWRMANHIRQLMTQDGDMLGGDGTTVEADETYIGGHANLRNKYSNKKAVIGVTERYGRAKAVVAPRADASIAIPFLKATIKVNTVLHTDDSRIYHRAKLDFQHASVNHSAKQYVDGMVHTNSIEGFWSQLKRSMDGTYHVVSPKHLQMYVDEFVFRYNHRDVAVCPVLLERAGTLLRSGV